MADPSILDKATQAKDAWELILGVLTAIGLSVRWVWNIGSGMHKRISALEEAAKVEAERIKATDKSISDFTDKTASSMSNFTNQAATVLEKLNDSVNYKLERMDDAMAVNLQTLSSISERTKDVSDRLSRVEDKCLGKNC